MSVADKLNTLRGNIISAYDAIEAKEGTVPSNENTQNLATAIASIPSYLPLTLYYLAYGNSAGAQALVDRLVANSVVPVASAGYAFANTSTLASIDLSGLDLSNITSTEHMFDGAASLTSLDLSASAPNLPLSSTNADYMLAGMTSLRTLNLSGWKSGSDDLASSNFWDVDLLKITQYKGNTEQQSYTGKNLFNSSNIGWTNSATVTTSGNAVTVTSKTTGVRFAAFVIPNPSSLLGKTITLSRGGYTADGSTNVRLRLMFGTASPSPALSSEIINISDDTASGSATVPDEFPSGYDSIVLLLYASQATDTAGSSVTYNEVQVEIGSAATSYEPYVGGVAAPNPDYPQPVYTVTGEQTVSINDVDYPISLGGIELCKIGNYQDYIYKSGEGWYIRKETGKVVLNGSENWQDWAIVTEEPLVGFLLDDYVNYNNSNGNDIRGLSDYFKVGVNAITAEQGIGLRQVGDTLKRLYVSISNTIVSDLPSFKAWLSAHNVLLYYALATPTTTEITDAGLLAQLNALGSYDADSTVTVSAVSPNLAAVLTTVSDGLTTLTLNGPKRLESGKLADSLVATFNSKQGSAITTLTMNNPEFFTTDGTTATLTDFSDVWSGSALTTLEMTGWDVSGVDPTDTTAGTTLENVANLTTLTIGDWTTPANGVNLATLLGVESGNTGSATALTDLRLTGSSVFPVYAGGTGAYSSANAFAGCPIGNGTGHIHVPASLVSAYQSDAFWSNYSGIIVAES